MKKKLSKVIVIPFSINFAPYSQYFATINLKMTLYFCAIASFFLHLILPD